MGNKCFKIKRVNRDKSEKDSTIKISNSYKKEKENNNKDLNLESLLSDNANNTIVLENNDKDDPINPIRNSYLRLSMHNNKIGVADYNRKSSEKSELNDFNNNNNFRIEGNIKITSNTNNNNNIGINQNIINNYNNLGSINETENDNNYLARLFIANNISFFNPNSEKIEDCYTFIRKIGNGAFGKCNLGQLMKGNKEIRYAIKTIELESIDKDKLILLKTEISCLKKLIHPNIVHFFQLFYDENNIHMVMEPCMNGSLFDKILEKGTFSEKEAIKIMISLLSAINYCHKNKIIHRDIKPENILLVNPVKTTNNTSEKTEWEYDLRLIDFGLSHIYSKKDLNSLLSSSVGSPYFMAPEVLNECYNSKCDIWSLGVLFYFLIAGVPPFYSDSIPELFKLILNSQPNFRTDIWKNVSNETKEAIAYMLIKDFRRRPSCEELLKLPCFNKELLKLHNPDKLLKCEGLISWVYDYVKHKNSFIKEISNAMSNQLCTSDFKKASYLFKILDSNNCGKISVNILLKFLSEKQVDLSPFKNVDDLQYSDIIEAITFKKFHNEDFYLHTFETFDIDLDSHITFNDFSTTIFKNASKITQLEIDQILKEVGLNRKFKLSVNEFRKMLVK